MPRAILDPSRADSHPDRPGVADLGEVHALPEAIQLRMALTVRIPRDGGEVDRFVAVEVVKTSPKCEALAASAGAAQLAVRTGKSVSNAVEAADASTSNLRHG